jgi:copper chaperone
METLKFKTNIKCGGCIVTVTPFLNQVNEIRNWEVDTVNPDKILTVEAENITAGDVISKIKEAGYTAESINAES